MNTEPSSEMFAPNVASSSLIPVSVARDGFTLAQAAELRARYTFEEGFDAGDVTLYEFLHASEIFLTAMIPRSGNVEMFEVAPDATIGTTSYASSAGEMTLDEYLVHPESRAQAMIVVHQGRVLYEQYPGMRDHDYHFWMSCSKPTTSIVLAQLEAEGALDVRQPVGAYIPELLGTAWEHISVLDVLDMASGLDLEENAVTRADPTTVAFRLNKAEAGEPNHTGHTETMLELIQSAPKLREPGQVLEYSSVNTQVLVLLAEAIENRRWPEIFRERVWSKLTGEGDATVSVTPDGAAIAHGLISTRLRDLARFGMLYTPSWNKAAREPAVPAQHLEHIRHGGRPEIYGRGSFGKRMQGSFAGDVPIANSRQWDAVFTDGDFFKSGLMGQGLYVSPDRDLVMVWFSTCPATDLTHYGRILATRFAAR